MNYPVNFVNRCRAFHVTVPRWMTEKDIYGPTIFISDGMDSDSIRKAVEKATATFHLLATVTYIDDFDAMYAPNGLDAKETQVNIKNYRQSSVEYHIRATSVMNAAQFIYAQMRCPDNRIVNLYFF